ncbi:hypothetical protein [Rhizobium rhizogenes]|uniref:hypothetical protein n=1 Tax=Rhizobium rhizogenes TaxID=359 RepID=UPI001574201B|nr:hypothetical protein [Rhizobium rhizogenes]NTI78697.1 hypothetical protein [Rhizobium rhizogenes]
MGAGCQHQSFAQAGPAVFRRYASETSDGLLRRTIEIKSVGQAERDLVAGDRLVRWQRPFEIECRETLAPDGLNIVGSKLFVKLERQQRAVPLPCIGVVFADENARRE